MCCLLISRKTAGLGAGDGFFHCFQKTENHSHAYFRRHETVSRPQQSHSRGHCPRPDTWLQGLPLRGPFHTVAPGRTDEREGGQCEGSGLTSYSTEAARGAGRGPADSGAGEWTPSPGSSPFPTLLPRKASLLFSKSLQARESQRPSP